MSLPVPERYWTSFVVVASTGKLLGAHARNAALRIAALRRCRKEGFSRFPNMAGGGRAADAGFGKKLHFKYRQACSHLKSGTSYDN